MNRFTKWAVVAGAVALCAAGHPPKRPAKFNKVLGIGDAAPAWEKLPGVDDETHSLSDYKQAKLVVLVFTSNQCPVSKRYEPRLRDVAQKWKDRQVQVVAINVSRADGDGLDKMKARARESEIAFPYLRDESQQTGRAYGAAATPQFFVLDSERRIAYMGAFDDNLDAAKVEKRYVADAVDALLAGKTPRVKESYPRGCPIEYEPAETDGPATQTRSTPAESTTEK